MQRHDVIVVENGKVAKDQVCTQYCAVKKKS